MIMQSEKRTMKRRFSKWLSERSRERENINALSSLMKRSKSSVVLLEKKVDISRHIIMSEPGHFTAGKITRERSNVR